MLAKVRSRLEWVAWVSPDRSFSMHLSLLLVVYIPLAAVFPLGSAYSALSIYRSHHHDSSSSMFFGLVSLLPSLYFRSLFCYDQCLSSVLLLQVILLCTVHQRA